MEVGKEITAKSQRTDIAARLGPRNLISIMLGVAKLNFATKHLAEMPPNSDLRRVACFEVDWREKGIGISVDIARGG